MEYTTHNVVTESLNNPDTTTLIWFSANWCSPCRAIYDLMDDFQSSLPEGSELFKVSADDAGSLIADYNISGIPTLIVVSNDTVQRHVGPPNIREFVRTFSR